MSKKNKKNFAENWQKKDPFFVREQKKYGENPLPSREYILQVLDKEGRLLSFSAICDLFMMREVRADLFSNRIKAMIHDGQLMSDRQGRIGVVKKMNLKQGIVLAHPEGYGFLQFEDEEEDGFIPPRYMSTLMHHDKILARVYDTDYQGRKNYAPVEILERGQKRFVGKLEKLGKTWYINPENRRLSQQFLVADDMRLNAELGDIVTAEITIYPSRKQPASARVIKVLGKERAFGMEVEIALENYNIPHEFSKELLKKVNSLPDVLQENEIKGRLDLRHLPFVTIDGINSRDFDDAVYAEKRGKNYALFVAIADVSHYVKKDSELDREAQLRGTSVYFPDRVIPMLPEKLSNGLCSLNPNVDRLALVCEMTLNQNGELRRSRFHQAIIHSHARLTYETAQEVIFDEDKSLQEDFKPILKSLFALKTVYEILWRAREARYCLNFDFPEPEFEYDSEGKIEKIQARSRLDSHKLIEECMILANIAAAKFLEKHKMPALYRVHDAPSIERLFKLQQFLAKLGLKWRVSSLSEITPRDICELLNRAQMRADYSLLEKMVLRSMETAIYSAKNRGHFGLALSHYAHFTSPIRRYPDLLVHRAIVHILEGGSYKNYAYQEKTMVELGTHTSMTERRADDATREAMDYLKCEFMSQHIGACFKGSVSNVTNFGLFVTLEDFFIDGLVHISSLPDDYYLFDETQFLLRGERTGRIFKMMDSLQVCVAKVDIEDRKIDFVLQESTQRKAKKKKRAKRRC